MTAYKPPVEDMLFVMEAVLDAPSSWRQLPDFAELDLDLAREVLQQAARFAQDVLEPMDGPGDLQGCGWHQGDVVTPEGYAAAWRQFVAGGWPALACAVNEGGQGLPQLLNIALYEMLAAANHAWTMYPGLQHGAYEAVRSVASTDLRDRYLPKLVSGEWLATMNLTEPDAGSDLGQVRCRAVPKRPDAERGVRNGDAVQVTGGKIFISGGDHDLTDNIVHLVLARLPEALPGTKGLSLFLVPKLLPDAQRNTVFCDGIEKKMGIKGSATCQMRFENAQGWLLGEPGSGLAVMFKMMNAARLHVAIQGLGHLEAATQIAVDYALDRVQSRVPEHAGQAASPASPGASAVTIAQHPAVRRVLLDLQAQCEAARVMAYHAGLLLDEAEHHVDATVRKRRHDSVALLTPVLKAFLTHLGHHGADRALGVLGGYGYIHEYGIEQHVRDSRIAMIYEGTNEIQAIDLLQRKVLDRPERIQALMAEWRAEQDLLEQDAANRDRDASLQLLVWRDELERQIGYVELAVHALKSSEDRERAFRIADDFLHGLGHALMAWAWARITRVALKFPDRAACRRRIDLAEHGRRWVLPAARVHWERVADARLELGDVSN